MPKSVKLKLKGGGYVDPDSGLQDKVMIIKLLGVGSQGGLSSFNLNYLS